MRRLLTFLLLLSLCLFSCAKRREPPPREILDRMLAALPLGSGVVYDSTLPKSHAEHLDPLLFRALYARADGSDDSEDIAAAALFLGGSAVSHREIGIFSCRGNDSAREVAALCRARADLLSGATETPARVLIYGETVILLVLPDLAPAIRLLDRLLA